MKIIAVDKASIAGELNIKVNDELIGFNHEEITDVFDYHYFNSLTKFFMTIQKSSNGILYEYEIEKDEHDDLGLQLDTEIEVQECCNNCIFCFVDQLPRCARATLRVKDDDYRLSLTSGNFITMTNMSQGDLSRICKLHLSPLYISVHSADNEIRTKMIGRKCDDLLGVYESLHANGITLHGQIVYCPTINEDYEETACKLAPFFETLAIVPVGLTKYHTNSLIAVSADDAKKILLAVERVNSTLKRTFLFASDEIYLLAGEQLPSVSHYGNLAQLGNGVGMLSKFEDEVDNAIPQISKNNSTKRAKFSIATGVSAYKFITAQAKKLAHYADIKVYCVDNDFWGSNITVAGLLTGSDIYNSLKNEVIQGDLLISASMLNDDKFLDDMTLSQLSDKLKVKIIPVDVDGYNFVETIVGELS